MALTPDSRAEPALMSLPQVARYLGMSERTIYGWAQSGRIPAFKLGAAWRFRRSEIDAWLESHHSGPTGFGDDAPLARPLTRPVEPQRSEWRTRQERERAHREKIDECKSQILDAMRLEDRSAFAIDRFVDERHPEDVVQEAVEELRAERKINRSNMKTPYGDRITVIERRR